MQCNELLGRVRVLVSSVFQSALLELVFEGETASPLVSNLISLVTYRGFYKLLGWVSFRRKIVVNRNFVCDN